MSSKHRGGARAGGSSRGSGAPPAGAAASSSTKLTVEQAAAVLGVPEGADEAAVKSAYRKLALKYHPDKAKDMTQEEAGEWPTKASLQGWKAGHTTHS